MTNDVVWMTNEQHEWLLKIINVEPMPPGIAPRINGRRVVLIDRFFTNPPVDGPEPAAVEPLPNTVPPRRHPRRGPNWTDEVG